MMGLVDAGLTFRSGFEASMYPIILRRVLAHIFFDQGIHALGGLFQSAFAGKVGHGFEHLNMVVARLGIQAGNHGNDQRILIAGNLGSGQQGGGRDIEKGTKAEPLAPKSISGR